MQHNFGAESTPLSHYQAIVSRYRKLGKSEADKPFTIDIPAKTIGWGASTYVKPRPAAQNVDTESTAIVEQSKDKLPRNKVEAPAHFQVSNRSYDMTLAADSSDCLPKDQADQTEIETQSVFGVGHLLCITDFEQQHNPKNRFYRFEYFG